MILFYLFGICAILAFAATCLDRDTRWLGAWLLLGFIISNLLYFGGVPPLDRVGPYTLIEIMVAFGALFALVKQLSWALVMIIFLNLISIGANIALALQIVPDGRQIYAWNLTTNLCFAGECALATWVGLSNGFRVGRFDRWLRPRRDVVSARRSHNGGKA